MPIPSWTEGRIMIVATWDGDAVDADVALDGRNRGVRQKRVVLAPVTASSPSRGQKPIGDDGGNRGRLTGEITP